MVQAGQQIGAYEIETPIGRGGMATVYKAYHQHLDRHVAIKVMHESLVQDEDFLARFKREAQIVARLEHMNIVPIYDYNEHEGKPYLVMKFIDGMTLKRRIIKTGFTPLETCDVLTEVANGLDYAHRQGILHRDMKPSNILIDHNNRVYITDFGLARIAELGASTISRDMMLGTPFYISPEQARGDKDLDNRADIYSLAIILYELITGRVPFHADTPYAIVHGHIHGTVIEPSDQNSDLPSAVDAVLARGLAKNPQDRYSTAREMMDAFRTALNETETVPTPVVDVADDLDDFDDLDDIVVKEPKAKNTLPTALSTEDDPFSFDDVIRPNPRNQAPVVPSPDPRKRREVEAQFDFGDWSGVGDNIERSVNSLVGILEDRASTEWKKRRDHLPPLTEEQAIRRQIKKRMEARAELVQHVGWYFGVNLMLVFIWWITGSSFFWPMFPIFFWGLGVAGQGFEYYNKFGGGAQRREALIEEEVQRKLEESNTRRHREKSKSAPSRLSLDAVDNRLQDMNQATEDYITGRNRQVRLNEDGELTDSFIEEQGRR